MAKKSLLLELEERNILPNYSCRQGHCGVCVAKLIDGKVLTNNVLYPLDNDDILLCSTKPTTDLVLKIL
jgi:ferredoxin